MHLRRCLCEVQLLGDCDEVFEIGEAPYIDSIDHILRINLLDRSPEMAQTGDGMAVQYPIQPTVAPQNQETATENS